MKYLRYALYPLIFAISIFFFIATVHAQDVYNFYFQKAPGGNTVSTPAPAVTAPGTAAPLPASPAPSLAPASEGTSTAVAAKSDETNSIRHWSFQLMQARVADSYTDTDHSKSSRPGFVAGYRYNKYFGGEFGSSVGTISGVGSSSSIVPFVGLRLNALHLNVFGTEIAEFFATTGAIYLDASTYSGGTYDPGSKRELYGYVGGGFRICLSDRFGVEVAARLLSGKPEYGMATTGIDLRF